MDELDQLARDMGIDPESPEERLGDALAEGDLNFLDALVRFRVEKNLTQQDVADAMKRDKSSVSRFEAMDSDPRLSTIRRYARAIGALVEHEVSDFSQSTSDDKLHVLIWGNTLVGGKLTHSTDLDSGKKVRAQRIRKADYVYRPKRTRVFSPTSKWNISALDAVESDSK